jgi:hypothetical protein
MQFDNPNIQDLVSQYRDFSVEGFNIFAVGKDHLPHLICVCPNKAFARAIQLLLTIAKLSCDLPKTNAEVTSNCVLSPMILADGTLALVAALINDAVWKNGSEVEYDDLELHLGTSPYRDFVTQFISSPQETPSSSAPATVLHVYEDTLINQDPPKDEFPF